MSFATADAAEQLQAPEISSSVAVVAWLVGACARMAAEEREVPR